MLSLLNLTKKKKRPHNFLYVVEPCEVMPSSYIPPFQCTYNTKFILKQTSNFTF